jgi:hypothetical protein
VQVLAVRARVGDRRPSWASTDSSRVGSGDGGNDLKATADGISLEIQYPGSSRTVVVNAGHPAASR